MKARSFRQRKLVACATALAVGLVGLTGEANAQFPQLIPTRTGLVKFGGSPPVGRLYKFVSKAPRGGPFLQLPSSSPATTGGSLRVTIGSGTLDCTLAAGLYNGAVGWKELGSPAGSKGYKYLNKNAPTADPCKVVIVKEKAISVIALGTGSIAEPVDYPPGSPDISTVLTLGGDEYCGYAPAPHFRERADRYIKASDESAPGSCPAIPPNCCSGGLDLLSFETGIPSGTCGVLSNFRCSGGDPDFTNHACDPDNGDADCGLGPCYTPYFCAGDPSISCTSQAQCQGTCGEVSAGNLPLDLDCGAVYVGGGLNSVPLPIAIHDRDKFFVRLTSCNGATGEMTLGPTTPAEVGTRHCTQGRQCTNDGSPCVLHSDCGAGTCEDLCLFGAPLPMPNAGTPATSTCVVKVVGEDASGTAQCVGGAINLTIPRRSVVYLNGDLFKASTPPDIPGVQPCPLCDYLCQGGSKGRFPCDDDSECPGGSCGAPRPSA